MAAGDTRSLAAIGLFQGLPDEARAKIESQCDWQTLPAGRMVLSEKDSSDAIFFIISGLAAVKSFSADGHEVSYSEFGKGALFGEFSAIDGRPRSAQVQTVKPSVIASLRGDAFRELVRTVPGLGLALCQLLVTKNRQLSERIYEFSTMSVRMRICAELVRLAEARTKENGEWLIDPAPSHYELSTRLATHREAVSRELSALASQGIVRSGRRKMAVLDLDALRAILANDG